MTKDGVVFDAVRFMRRLARTAVGREVLYLPRWWIRSTRVGSPGAAFRVCPSAISRDSVVYSFGAGEDVSFDLELIRRFGVCVHAFDPTPKSIAWLRTQTLPPQFVLHEYGLADFDGTARFAPPSDPRHVSYSLATPASREAAVEGAVYRLPSIMRMLGHTRVDVLKMDIEGAEYGAIGDLLTSGPLPNQVLVEFHHRWPEVGLERTKHAVAALRSRSYRLFAVSASGTEYGFVLDSGRPIDDAITNAPAGRERRGRARS